MSKRQKVKRILSAGGIVFRPTINSGLEVLLEQHSGYHGWTFPKGQVEKGEAPAKAAHREVEEEVGVKGEIVDKAGTTTYFYVQERQRIFKTVIFFLMRYTGEGKATEAWEVEDKEWLPIEKVAERLTFDDDKKLWQQAIKRLRELKKKS